MLKELRELRIGEWEISLGEEKAVPRIILEQLEEFLSTRWREAAMRDVEETGSWWWGARKLGIPSPIVRIDMSPMILAGPITKYLYEVEVRPAGLGVTLSLIPTLRPIWRKILKEYGCQGFIHLESLIQDDRLAADILGIPYYEEPPKEGGLFWIRTGTDDPRAPDLEKKSVVPIRLDGYKGYLVRLGLAQVVKDPSDLPWEESFVIKPLQGSRMDGVEIWGDAYLRRQNKPGLSTKKRIVGRLERPYLVQPFICPCLEENQGREGWTIWRLFFGWQGKYVFIGGVWNWRPNLRIHGSSDAVTGSLIEKFR